MVSAKKDDFWTMYTFNAMILRVKQGECVYEEPHILAYSLMWRGGGGPLSEMHSLSHTHSSP